MRFSTGKLFVLGVVGMAMALFPADGLRALGLGEARVDSYLGQVLDVTIRLVEADSAALDSLTVAPATSRDYERLGIPADALSAGLEVTVDRRVDPPLVRVRSRRPVSDPVIQFLVDARWSGGRLLREYTLFLDPPTVDVAPPVARTETPRTPVAEPRPEREPEPVSEPRPRAPVTEPAREPSREPTPEPVDEPTPPVEAPAAADPRPDMIGPIGAGQTLWSVAYTWRPDSSLSMNQVMFAIFERNPQAFIGGNVNQLRRGAELNMPSLDEVRGVSAAEADRRIREQIQDWQQGTARRDVPVVAEAAVPEVEAESPDAEPAPDPGRDVAETPDVVHRLEVVPPESDTFDEGPTVSEGEISRASGRLSELEDRMYAEALDRDDLVRQIDQIREAIDTREAAGLAVADEEMAMFEDRLRSAREAREADEAALAEADDDEVGAYFRQLEDELGLAGGDGPELAESETTETTEATEEAEPLTTTAPAPMPVAATTADRGTPIWMWALGAAVVLLALILLLVIRRRTAATSAESDVAGYDVDAERARVAADPSNLAAHLALLEALGARDDTEGFSNALDDMYRQVENEEDPHWQDALNLAVVHAPNHPLLTPRETPLADDVADDEGLDDRTREMLGILGAGESQSDRDAGQTSPDDYEIDSDLQPDDDERLFGDAADEFAEPGDAAETSGDDDLDGDEFDLAAISDRLDRDGDDADRSDKPAEESDEVLDLNTDELGEDALSLDVDEDDAPLSVDELDESADPADRADSELDLDFKFGESRPDSEVDATESDPDDELEAFLRPGSESDGSETGDEGEPALSDEDAEVKLDLARAYLSMDDPDSARTLLEEITSGGSSSMREQARKLLDDI